MYFKFNGDISGIQSGDAVKKIELCWMLSGVDAAEIDAITNGRYISWDISTDSVKITGFQSTGWVSDVGNIAAGDYTPSVRITESRASSADAVGAWTRGTPFTVVSVSLGTPGSFSGTGTSSAVLTWSVGTGTPLGYNVYRAPDTGGAPGNYSFLGYTTGLTFTDTTALSDATYWYKISAVNDYVESSMTSTVTLTPPWTVYEEFKGSIANATEFYYATLGGATASFISERLVLDSSSSDTTAAVCYTALLATGKIHTVKARIKFTSMASSGMNAMGLGIESVPWTLRSNDAANNRFLFRCVAGNKIQLFYSNTSYSPTYLQSDLTSWSTTAYDIPLTGYTAGVDFIDLTMEIDRVNNQVRGTAALTNGTVIFISPWVSMTLMGNGSTGNRVVWIGDDHTISGTSLRGTANIEWMKIKRV